MSRPRLLVLTNLYALPWAPNRATFNQQQFAGLSSAFDVTILVPITWTAVLSHWAAYLKACLRPSEGIDSSDDSPRIKVRYTIFWHVPGWGYRFNAFLMFCSVLLQNPIFLLRGRWDCILGSWAYPDAVCAVWLSRLLRAPVLVKLHGSDINVIARRSDLKEQVVAALNRADAVISVSRDLMSKAVALGVNPDRLQVLYNGVDTQHFRPLPASECERQLSLDTARKRVLFVGNLLASKGALDLLEAFGRFAEHVPEADLVYIGQGPAGKVLLERVQALRLSERVFLKGSINHADLPVWFNACRVLCLPSHNEGVPNVVLEAMACGVPVVATRVGGVPEVLTAQHGWLVEVGEIDALAAALQAVLQGRSPRASGTEEGLGSVLRPADRSWADSASDLISVIDSVRMQVPPSAAPEGMPDRRLGSTALCHRNHRN
jgi:glycosyltransferase involved in cell wall biosynthesis